MKMKTVIDTGNHIAALAAKMARPEVIAAYPITPQTRVVERIAEYVEGGELDAEYIRVESEHSAMTACIAAEAAGVRTFTATACHGLLLMHEMLHWAALSRLPIVFVNVNRAVGPGWSIWADCNDSMAQRDTGLMQFYCSSCQEIYDSIIQAYKIAEDRQIQLPIMVCYDGFILSHTSMPVKIPSQATVDDFLPKYSPHWLLDVKNPVTHGNIIGPEYYMEIRKDMHDAQERAKELIPKIAKEWEEHGGNGHGLIEEYKCEDAEWVIVTLGALGAEAKVAVDDLRKKGEKVGLAKIRTFRPFPKEKIREIAKNSSLVIIDRNISMGMEGVVSSEVKSSLHGMDSEVRGFIAGLGGRDVTYKDIEKIVEMAKKGKSGWYGLK